MAQINWASAPQTGNAELDAFLDDLLAIVRTVRLEGNDIEIHAGAGSPEGVVTARVGSVYLRTDGIPSLYVKESGTGATGWVGK